MRLDSVLTIRTSPARFIGRRCLHYAEGGDPHELGAPAVHNSDSIGGVDFEENMQLLSFYINSRPNSLRPLGNPNFTGSRWRSVYGNGTAFTNEQGFGKDGDPRADFVNRLELDEALPRLMRAIICSGSFFRGIVEQSPRGEMLTFYPGVHGINVNQHVGYDDAFIERVIGNQWYFYAVSADLQAASHFTQGVGMPVIIPLFLKVPTQYPLSWFATWNETYLPNPTTFYRPVN